MTRPVFAIMDVNGEHSIRVITFEIPGGVTTPEEFSSAVEEINSHLAGEFGMIIDGRGPVWGFAMIIHAAHPTKWIATRDPRLGAVVISSHDTGIKVGQVLPFPV